MYIVKNCIDLGCFFKLISYSEFFFMLDFLSCSHCCAYHNLPLLSNCSQEGGTEVYKTPSAILSNKTPPLESKY